MRQAFLRGDHSHIVELVKELVCEFNASAIFGVQPLERADQFGDHATKVVVLFVVVAVGDVVAAHDLEFAKVALIFVFEKTARCGKMNMGEMGCRGVGGGEGNLRNRICHLLYFFKQLLLVKFKLPHLVVLI